VWASRWHLSLELRQMSWSTLDLAFHCLADTARTRAFVEVLEEVVTPESFVIDAGSGSGVLAFAAARAGARQVVAVEEDPVTARVLAANGRDLGLRVEVICGDVRQLDLPRCDVLVAELIDVWLLEEQQAEALLALRQKGVIDERTILVPCGYEFDLDFGYCDWQFPEFNIRAPYYEWPYLQGEEWVAPCFRPLNEARTLGRVDFFQIQSKADLGLHFLFNLNNCADATLEEINAVRLSGTLHLAKGTSFGVTGSLNAPIVFPIERRGRLLQESRIEVRARMSGGFETLSITSDSAELLSWSS
jgi:SAM-dependent methyltransferase